MRRLESRIREIAPGIDRETIEAPVLLGELLLLPATARGRAVADHPRYATWALAELLVERGAELTGESRYEAEEIFELAFRVIDRLGPPAVEPALVADLFGRALVCFAALRRSVDDAESAGEALQLARKVLRQGTGDALEVARWSLESARGHQRGRSFAEAARDALRAGRLALEVGESALAASAYQLAATAHRAAGRTSAARKILAKAAEGLGELGAERERLALSDRLADCLLALDRPADARKLLDESLPAQRRFADPLGDLRRLSLSARVELAALRLADAEPLLVAALHDTVDQAPGMEAVLLAIELARLHLLRGRPAELVQLAAKLTTLEGRLSEQPAAALGRLRRLLAGKSPSRARLDALRTWADRARFDPDLPWPGSSS